jgi:hypothetical protein
MHPGQNRIAPALAVAQGIFMVVLFMASAAFALQAGSIGVVSAIFGGAEITHKEEAKPTPVTRRDKIYPMDKIETKEDAKVRILFEDGSILTIAEKTTMEINEFVYSPLDKVRVSRLSLALGKMRIAASNLFGYRDHRFAVNTPTATIGTRGTEHIDHVYEDKATGHLLTMVAVLDGEVGVVNPKFPAAEEVVKKFEFTIVPPDSPPAPARTMGARMLQQIRQGVYFMSEISYMGGARAYMGERYRNVYDTGGAGRPPIEIRYMGEAQAYMGEQYRDVYDTGGAGRPPIEWDPGTNPGVGGAILGGGAPDALGVNRGNVEIHWHLP